MVHAHAEDGRHRISRSAGHREARRQAQQAGCPTGQSSARSAGGDDGRQAARIQAGFQAQGGVPSAGSQGIHAEPRSRRGIRAGLSRQPEVQVVLGGEEPLAVRTMTPLIPGPEAHGRDVAAVEHDAGLRIVPFPAPARQEGGAGGVGPSVAPEHGLGQRDAGRIHRDEGRHLGGQADARDPGQVQPLGGQLRGGLDEGADPVLGGLFRLAREAPEDRVGLPCGTPQRAMVVQGDKLEGGRPEVDAEQDHVRAASTGTGERHRLERAAFHTGFPKSTIDSSKTSILAWKLLDRPGAEEISRAGRKG